MGGPVAPPIRAIRDKVELQLKHLQLPDAHEVVDYLFTLDEEDLKCYLEAMLGGDSKGQGRVNMIFAAVVKGRKREEDDQKRKAEALHPTRIQKPTMDSGVKVYKKGDEDDLEFAPKKKKPAPQKKKKSGKSGGGGGGNSQPKTRAYCTCLATEHPLLGICMECGKIICEQEGDGPCFFCNSEDLADDSAYGDDEALIKAMKQKEKLVAFDKLGERKNVIYDDQADFFESKNKWLAPEERKRLEQEEEDRLEKEKEGQKKICLGIDLGGRAIFSTEAAPLPESSRTNVVESGGRRGEPQPKAPVKNPYLDTPAPRYTPQNDEYKKMMKKSKGKKENAETQSQETKESGTSVLQHEHDEDLSFVWV